MALVPLIDEVAIRNAFERLKASWANGAEHLVQLVSFRPETRECDVYWRPELEMWGLFIPTPADGRYWCAFGTADPRKAPALEITCEINPPIGGINRRGGGLFSENGLGATYLMHSGRVGGGRKGIGKLAFDAFYRAGNRQIVDWPDGVREQRYVVGQLDSPSMVADVARYVRVVEQFKVAAATKPR